MDPVEAYRDSLLATTRALARTLGEELPRAIAAADQGQLLACAREVEGLYAALHRYLELVSQARHQPPLPFDR